MTSEQTAAWKAAIAAKNRRQRQQRGRRESANGISKFQPGMTKILPDTGTMSSLPRCPFPGCPVRYRGGPDRECPDHQNETLTAAAELGINLLDAYGIPPPGESDSGP